MKLLRRLSLIPVLLTFACTTTSDRQAMPPIAFTAPDWKVDSTLNDDEATALLEEFLERDSSMPMRWWVKYRQARLNEKNNPLRACENYAWLSKQRAFPLQEIAQLRALEHCKGTFSLLMPDFEELKKEKWLRYFAIRIEKKLADESGNDITRMKIHHEKSKWSTNRKEKIELTQKALKLARGLKDEENVQVLQKRLEMLSPRFKENPRKSELLAVAADHRYHREFEEAHAIYKQILNDRTTGENTKYKAFMGSRQTYRLQRRKDLALEVTKQLSRFVYRLFRRNKRGYADLYKRTILLYARTVWTEGSPRTATSLLRGLAEEVKGLTPLDQVYWIRGRIEEEAQRFHSATRWFDRALQECRRRCGNRSKLLWYKAWNLKKVKKYDEAVATLAQLSQITKGEKRSKVHFWHAKTLMEAGNEKLAAEIFHRTTEIDPFGYYGMMAQRELHNGIFPLGQSDKPISIAEPIKPYPGTFLHSDEGIKTAWMIAVEEKELAYKYLRDVIRPFYKKHSDDFRLWGDVLNLFAQAEAYQTMKSTLWKITSNTRNAIIQNNPQLLFPRPYDNLITSSADRFGIPSELIYSIIRQESAFNRTARSPADAFGLMQLIPSLANKVAKDIRMDYDGHEDLYKPHVNVPLGAAHLRDLWNRYNGQFVLMTASYNASERAIRGWVKHRFAGDPLKFIEDIPYQETQKYVKLVLRNFVLYQRLDSKDEIMPFPEWCLQNIQRPTI